MDSDLLPTDHIKKGYIGQTSNLMYRPGFRWYYLSDQKRNECLIFKMWDSLESVKAKCECTDTEYPHLAETDRADCPHVAFEHGSIDKGIRPRESIEIRALVFTYPRRGT